MFYLRYHLKTLHGIDDLDDEQYEGGSSKSHEAEGGSHTSLHGPADNQQRRTVSLKSIQNLKVWQVHESIFI